MRYVFIINPVAGKGNGIDTVVPLIEKQFSEDDKNYEVYITKQKEETKNIAEAQAKKGDDVTVFACGGEGTCFDVLNGIVKYPNAVLGVVPCGSANDFLKIFNNSEYFCDLQKQVDGECTDIDLIKCGDEYSFNGCSVGMDATVCKDMILFKGYKFVSGSMAYKLAIVKNFLFSKIGAHLEITVDGDKHYDDKYLFAVCSNGRVYGGGYMPAPNASPEDGKLDFTLVKKKNRLTVPAFLKDYEKGDFAGYDYVEYGNCSVMEIKADKPIALNRDGEITEQKSVKFELVPKGVKFLIPKGVTKKY